MHLFMSRCKQWILVLKFHTHICPGKKQCMGGCLTAFLRCPWDVYEYVLPMCFFPFIQWYSTALHITNITTLVHLAVPMWPCLGFGCQAALRAIATIPVASSSKPRIKLYECNIWLIIAWCVCKHKKLPIFWQSHHAFSWVNHRNQLIRVPMLSNFENNNLPFIVWKEKHTVHTHNL